MDAAKYVVKYLASTKNLGIAFTSTKRSILESFLHFPIAPTVLSMSDANWGPQDATKSTTVSELPLFASRSMSGFNLADIFTKEMKDTNHFVKLRDCFMCPRDHFNVLSSRH
jgi:hypothetical protein